MPGVSPAGYFRTLLALQLTLLLQTVFVCASVLAVQALATAALPSALAQRVATLVQAGFLLAAAVLPWVALPFAAQAFMWGLGAALPLALLCLAIGLASTEWLFLGFRKIPFTCSYLPGKAELRRSWPLAALVGFVYCIALPEIVVHTLRQRSAWLVLLALLTTLWACLFLLSKRRAGGEPLVFDERAVPLLTQLHWDD